MIINNQNNIYDTDLWQQQQPQHQMAFEKNLHFRKKNTQIKSFF